MSEAAIQDFGVPRRAIRPETSDEYERITRSFPRSEQAQRIRALDGLYSELSFRLSHRDQFQFGDQERETLRLQLAGWFQNHDDCDGELVYKALIENPGFLSQRKMGLNGLLRREEQSNLLVGAEKRKKIFERDGTAFNPWENLFSTHGAEGSGPYYLARLLNMPHLALESAYLRHCIGDGDSYLNRMKRREIEVFSLRHEPVMGQDGRLEGDEPVITFVYDVKKGTIESMTKLNHEFLSDRDPFFLHVVNALKQLQTTSTDMGKLREIKKIHQGQLKDVKISGFSGMSLTEMVEAMSVLFGRTYTPNQIALQEGDISPETKIYIGPLEDRAWYKFPIEQLLSGEVEIYTDFPTGKVEFRMLDFEREDLATLQSKLEQSGFKISPSIKDLIDHAPLDDSGEGRRTLVAGWMTLFTPDEYPLGGVSLEQVFEKMQTLGMPLSTEEILQLCLAYQHEPPDDSTYALMDPLVDSRGNKYLFKLQRAWGSDNLELDKFPLPWRLDPSAKYLFALG